MSLIAELKRRNVFRVGVAYAIVGWLLVEVAHTAFPTLQLPDWTTTLVTVLVIMGFPLALIVAWAFEMTPEGIKREADVDRTESVRHSTGRKLDFAIIGLLALAVVYFAVDIPIHPGPDDGPTDLVSVVREKSIAVLPFTNRSPNPDDIITALSRFRELFVIARNSTFRYKGKSVDVRELNRDLGARYVVEGSVRKVGARLRVTVQLLDARDGTHLWADTYDRDLSASDIFAVQDEITEQVVGTIASNSGVISRARFAEIKEKPTDSLDAYECVLQVGAYYRDNYIATEHVKVRACLERAVKSDPGYADAWAYLTFLYLDEYRFNYNPRPDSLDRALEAAQRAVDADPTQQLYPGFTTETLTEEFQKWNLSDDRLRLWVAALRKAGLP